MSLYGGGTAAQWAQVADEAQADAREWKARARAAEAALRDIASAEYGTDTPKLRARARAALAEVQS